MLTFRSHAPPWTHRAAPGHPCDPVAAEVLHIQYAAYLEAGYGHKNKPWEVAQALMLGRLYRQAWGCVPTANRLRVGSAYGLVNGATILRLFGSYSAYWKALEQAR